MTVSENEAGAMPTARAATPDGAEPVVSGEAGIPIAETGDWWIGMGDEYMNIGGPVATREKAIEIGRDYMAGDPFYITRAQLHAWSAPDAATVMDDWVNGTDEFWYEDGFPGFEGPNQREREKAAEADLQEVLNAWFERHKDMCPRPTAFAWCAGGEWIDRPAQGMEARKGGDEGSVHDSPVHAPETQGDSHDK